MKEKLKGILFFSVIFIIVDQIIKIALSSKMLLGEVFVVIRDFFYITLAHNTGAAFSIFSGNKNFLIVIGFAALIAIILYIMKLEVIDDVDIFIYSLLIGGIVGNLVDRLMHGYVIDYLSFKFGNYYFPIFNLADICIVISVILIFSRMIKEDLWK